MRTTRISFVILSLIFSLILSSVSFALTDGVEKLVKFETEANAAAQRSPKLIPLPHVEIPLELVGLEFAKRLDPKILQTLIIQNEKGEKFVRWILNPEDTKWGNELIQYFQDRKGLSLPIKYYFNGYQTASRSYIAEDPATGVQFSVKSSTNKTGGAWRDKKQPIGEAIDGRLLSDLFFEQNMKRPFKYFNFMDEPAILKIGDLDQAVVIRDLGALATANNDKVYLPGFSALHETVGKSIAAKNGSGDPYQFWTDNYIKPVGKALGELAARTGVQFDSPHSQNFLVELDLNLKPTGRIILRDMSDLYIDDNYIKALLGKENVISQGFTQKGNIHNEISAGFGPLHGNKFPSWITVSQYSRWKDIFFQHFESSFKEISGYDLAPLKTAKTQSGDYFGSSYKLNDKPAYKDLFRMMSREGVVSNPEGGLVCKFALTGS